MEVHEMVEEQHQQLVVQPLFASDENTWCENQSLADKTPQCVFVGETSLLSACMQVALSKGWQVVQVISSDEQVIRFAKEAHLPCNAALEGIYEVLTNGTVDYVFSVVNPWVLPAKLLHKLAGRVINYHNSLLPRYAGLHATSWALLRGETTHGITWHVVNEGIDTGDILLQQTVQVSPEDTAFTLNAHCYEVALKSFPKLLEGLQRGKLLPRPQDVKQRTYFSGKHRPAQGAILNWGKSALELANLFRALQFGPYPNPLGLPKILLGRELLLVRKLTVEATSAGAAGGTLISLDEISMQVATADLDIRVSEITTLSGQKILVKELQEKYQLQAGQLLPQLTHCEHQRLERLDAQLAPHQAYWVAQLAQVSKTTFPYSRRQPGNSHTVHSRIGSMACGMIAKLQSEGVHFELGPLLSTAFAVYLTRLTSNYSLSIGYSSTYLQAQLAELPAFFAPYVPLNVNLSADETLETAYRTVQHALGQLQKRSTYAQDLVVRYPVLQTRPGGEQAEVYPVNILWVTSLENVPSHLPGEVTMVIALNEGKYAMCCHGGAIGEATLQQMIDEFETLLASLTKEPSLPLHQHQLLSSEQRQRILYQWNDTATAYDTSVCMHHLFERQAEKTPTALAVRCGQQQLSYQQLNQQSNQLAHYLMGLGVRPGTRVGILLEKRVEMVVGVLAVLKAGGAYVPLDPAAPAERLASLLEDLELTALLTQAVFQEKYTLVPDTTSLPVLVLDTLESALGRQPSRNPVSGVTSGDLAYIIYTSGSTGMPKGVMVRHQPVVNLIEWVNRTFAVKASDQGLFVNSLGFDLSVYDIFGLLAAGASIRMASQEELADPQRLLEIVSNEPITFWNSAPAALSQLIPFRPAGHDKPLASCLRLAFLSGDWIPLSMPAWLQQTFPGVEVVSLGGATEATVWSNYYRIKQIDPAWVSIPYGYPIQNARYHILDKYLQPVPIGVTGELYIGGQVLAEGYFNRSELNQEKFIPDLFSTCGNDRLYKTGDLARYWADGTMEFLGRSDHQVKIRGYRVEPGEIEAVLSQLEALQQVLVVAAPDPVGGKRLVAYLVAKPGASLTTEQLRTYLAAKLPEYMLPAAFIWLKQFPLNPSGKIDRKALPPYDANTERNENYDAPRNTTETLLANIWQEHLKINKIGIHDNFFLLGGHSLAAGKVIAAIQQKTGTSLPLSAMFAHPTIAQLAPMLFKDKQASAWKTLVPIRPTGCKPPLFFLHPAAGDVEYAYKLAAYLDKEQPVYGILAKGLQETEAPFASIEEAAESYLAELLACQPNGPYHLAGYSYGGYVAYEMAQRLVAKGQNVQSLILFDTYPNNVGRRYRLYGLKYVIFSFFNLLTTVSCLKDFYRNQYWRLIVQKCSSLLKLIILHGRILPYHKNVVPQPDLQACTPQEKTKARLMATLDSACTIYDFKPYPGKIIFIRAVEGAAKYYKNSDFGWKKNALGGTMVHDILHIHHLSMFEEDKHVHQIADIIQKYLP